MTEQLNLKHCRDVLVEGDAISLERIDSTFAQLRRDGEIVRAWKLGVPDDFSMLREYLDQYTSAKNNGKMKYVDAPMMDDAVVDDARYRQAFITKRQTRDDSGDVHTYLVQTLRRGYITSLGSGSVIDWDECRIEQVRKYPGNDRTMSKDPAVYLALKWQNVSPEHRIGIVDYLSSKKTVTPKYRGKTMAAHTVLYALDSSEDDGSATVTLYIGNPQYELGSFSSARTERQVETTILHACPRSLAQAILDAHKSTAGNSADVGGSFTDGTVTLYLHFRTYEVIRLLGIITHRDCDFDYVSSYYWGVKKEDEALYAIPTAMTAGWSYDKRVSSNGDGSIDITLIVVKRKYRAFEWVTTFISGFMEAKSKRQLGVTTQALDDITAPPRGTSYERRIDRNNDCSSNVDTQKTVSVPQKEAVSWATKFGLATRTMFWNWVLGPTEDGELKTLISSLSSGSDNSVSNSLNRDNSKDYAVMQSPYAGSFDLGLQQGREVQSQERMEYRLGNGQNFWQTVAVTYDIKAFYTADACYDWISHDNQRYTSGSTCKIIDPITGVQSNRTCMRTHGNTANYTGGNWMGKRYVFRGEPVVANWNQIAKPNAVDEGDGY